MITDNPESAEINVVYVADRIVQGEALCVAKIVCNVTLTSGIGGHTTSFMVIFSAAMMEETAVMMLQINHETIFYMYARIQTQS